jgi:para-nitrobenzyl esterase
MKPALTEKIRETAGALLHFGLLAACLSPAVTLAADSQAALVFANGEELHGNWVEKKKRIAEFKGIPFAAPPVGELRWRAPQPHAPRTGVQDASRFAAACMQDSSGADWYEGVAAAFGHGPEVVGNPDGKSEDCLYLNAWSPEPRSGLDLPVMVFVHGGSNSGGWSYEPNYLGRELAARGVVVVTVAYRLGPFGFFSHPALGDGKKEPVANFALLDIRKAFEWVRDNIQAFGGDPDNITAFGESAGAFNIVDLLLADMARGKGGESLFRRLVSQSLGGSFVIRQTLAEEQAMGILMLGQLGIPADVSAERLRKIPAEDLLEATQGLPEDHNFDAVVDGRTFPRHPLETLRQAQAVGVDLIAGSNADEWYMYIDEGATSKDLENWIMNNAPEQREALHALLGEGEGARRSLDRLRTARNMLCPSRYLAARVNDGGGRAWMYYFTRQRGGAGGERLRAYHGAELPYVFDTHDAWLPTDEADREVTQAVMDYWVQFARNGDPNQDGRPQWPVHTAQRPAVMELGDRVGQMESFDVELCSLLGPGSRRAEVKG